ncbi:MAG: disulfide bond formation protein B [Hyphomicrobiales bacterium]
MKRTDFVLPTVFWVSIITLVGAWSFEIFGFYRPCPLCLIERWPYYAVVGVVVSAKLRSPWTGKPIPRHWLLAVCGVIMLASASLGIHHAGLEWGWWSESAACRHFGVPSSHMPPDLSAAPIVACDRAAWRFLGLSLAGYNAILSLGLAVIAFWGALAHRRADASRSSPVHGSSSLSQ